VTSKYAEEIAANMARAEESIQAAKQLISTGYYDFAGSRAYYAAFYAATAVLLAEELQYGKHSGVIAAIHRNFVKTGKLDQQFGRDLNWLFELRSVGDYGGHYSRSPGGCGKGSRGGREIHPCHKTNDGQRLKKQKHRFSFGN